MNTHILSPSGEWGDGVALCFFFVGLHVAGVLHTVQYNINIFINFFLHLFKVPFDIFLINEKQSFLLGSRLVYYTAKVTCLLPFTSNYWMLLENRSIYDQISFDL